MSTVKAKILLPAISDVSGLDPLHSVTRIAGVRVYDVGQGDAIALLDQNGEPFFHLDYGGRQGNMLKTGPAIDLRLPVHRDRLVMLTHWDEDHWCTARNGQRARAAMWLVPRQSTSPRAVAFSLTLSDAKCIPESVVGIAQRFETQSADSDSIWWEKLGAHEPGIGHNEDCNRTGVAFAVVSGRHKQVILLSGDAAFDRASFYQHFRSNGYELRGMVAYHHGSSHDWRLATSKLLEGWKGNPTVLFSCAESNPFGHPNKQQYQGVAGAMQTTFGLRAVGLHFCDILFGRP